jgi:acylphosphatase
MSSERITKQIYFNGRVQGVGFRWTTNRIAAGYSVTGFVRNLPDGRVEAVVSGQTETVDTFVDAVRTHFADNITSIEESIIDEPASFNSFEIRR